MAIPLRIMGDFMVGDVPERLYLVEFAGGSGLGRLSRV
jgi:hypothetical protein